MEKEKQEKWLTALQFAALCGRPGDQHFIKNKTRSGKIIKCPKFAEKRAGGKPTGLWPESYVLKWVADFVSAAPGEKTSRITEQMESINRQLDNSLARDFLTGAYLPKEQKNSVFFRRMHARLTQPNKKTVAIQEQQ